MKTLFSHALFVVATLFLSATAWAVVTVAPAWTCKYQTAIFDPVFEHQAGQWAVSTSRAAVRNEANSILVGDAVQWRFFTKHVQVDAQLAVKTCSSQDITGQQFVNMLQPTADAQLTGTRTVNNVEGNVWTSPTNEWVITDAGVPLWYSGATFNTTILNFVPGEPASTLWSFPSYCHVHV